MEMHIIFFLSKLINTTWVSEVAEKGEQLNHNYHTLFLHLFHNLGQVICS